MIALVPVRDAVLPIGADEVIAECGGQAIIVGSGTARAELEGICEGALLIEAGPFEPGRWSTMLAPVIAELEDVDVVVLPNSPDGRDLAPRLAFALDRPLLAGATEIARDHVRLVRRGGSELHEHRPTGAFVATLEPGVRSAATVHSRPVLREWNEPVNANSQHEHRDAMVADATVIEVLAPDVRTMDLAEAARIVGGGAGLESEDRFAELEELAIAIQGVMGATRVVTDRSWVHHDRQIGTTGVVVDPELYISFGISGAVQHTSGLGHPDHIISVNTDPHCPMMTMSDLAIECDANATLGELLRRLKAQDAR